MSDMQVLRAIQKPTIVFNSYNSLAIGATQIGEGVACVGHTMFSGSCYSFGNSSIHVDVGVNDQAGALTYRKTFTTLVVAGTMEAIEIPISPFKFVRVRIENTSGALNPIEAFFVIRPQE